MRFPVNASAAFRSARPPGKRERPQAVLQRAQAAAIGRFEGLNRGAQHHHRGDIAIAQLVDPLHRQRFGGGEAFCPGVGIDGCHAGRPIQQDHQMFRVGALRQPGPGIGHGRTRQREPQRRHREQLQQQEQRNGRAAKPGVIGWRRRDHLPEAQGRHRFLHRGRVTHVEEDDQRNADQRQQAERRQQLHAAHPTTPRCESSPSTTVSNGQSVCRVMSGICSDSQTASISACQAR